MQIVQQQKQEFHCIAVRNLNTKKKFSFLKNEDAMEKFAFLLSRLNAQQY